MIKYREKFSPVSPPASSRNMSASGSKSARSTPYMEKVFPIRVEQQARRIPAGNARGRRRPTANRFNDLTNPLYHALISKFHEKTGVPIVLNTSLNENEPIVRTPAEAINCFLRTDMDALVLGNHLIDRHRPGFPHHKHVQALDFRERTMTATRLQEISLPNGRFRLGTGHGRSWRCC